MTKEIKLPEISESAEAGIVAEIMVSKGDQIEENQSIIAVESDKATVEVPSEFAGTVKDIKVKKDDEVNAGDVILTLETDSDNGEEDKNKTKDKTESKKKEEDTEEKKEKGSDSDKEQKEEVKAEQKEEPKAQKEKDKEEDRKETDEEEKEEEKPQAKTTDKEMPAAPLARRLARELDIDIDDIKEREADDRITSNDIMQYVKKLLKEGKGDGAQKKEEGIRIPDFSKWGDVIEEPLSNVRRITAQNVSASWKNIPHVTHFDEAKIGGLERYRQGLKENNDISLSITAIIIKLLGEGLKRFPEFNSSIDLQNNKVFRKKYFNISVAVDTKKGLMMPVIRRVNKKTIEQISDELKELVEKSQKGKVDKEMMEGGNMAVSNLGVIGGSQFTPVIFPPQSSILGMSSEKVVPKFNKKTGSFKAVKVLPLALSYDHRLIDGANAARFMNWLVKSIENPIHVFAQ